MCLVKKPKVVTSTAAEAKEAPVITNPYLDGLPAILRARRGGVQSLTIRRTGGSGSANTAPGPRPTAPNTPVAPGGGGSGGGSGGDGPSSRDLAALNFLSIMPGSVGAASRKLQKKVSP